MKNLKFEKIDDAKFDALSIENMRSVKGMKAVIGTTLDTLTICDCPNNGGVDPVNGDPKDGVSDN